MLFQNSEKIATVFMRGATVDPSKEHVDNIVAQASKKNAGNQRLGQIFGRPGDPKILYEMGLSPDR